MNDTYLCIDFYHNSTSVHITATNSIFMNCKVGISSYDHEFRNLVLDNTTFIDCVQAIVIKYGSVNLSNSVITKNGAGTDFPQVEISNTCEDFVATNTLVHHNSNDGGQPFSLPTCNTLTLTNVDFYNNTRLYDLSYTGAVNISGCNFTKRVWISGDARISGSNFLGAHSLLHVAANSVAVVSSSNFININESCIRAIKSAVSIQDCHFINHTGLSATYSAIRITEGSNVTCSDSLFLNGNGAVIYATDSELTLLSSNVESNNAIPEGVLMGSQSIITVMNCTFNNNTATDTGSITLENCLATILNTSISWENSNSTLRASNSTLQLSGVTIAYGGIGVDLRNNSSALMDNLMVEFNTNSGLILSNSSLILTNSSIRNNTAVLGGGMNIDAHSEITLQHVKCYNNQASKFGGCAYFEGVSHWESNEIYSNLALEGGGGIYASASSTTSINLVTCSNNYTPERGGCASIEGVSDWNESVMEFNSAGIGGGIHTSIASFVSMVAITCKNNTGVNGGCAAIEGRSEWNEGAIDSNSAENGGGVHTSVFSQVTMRSIKCTNNTGINGGCGAIEGTSDWIDSVISSNSAENGGGLHTSITSVLYMASSACTYNIGINGGCAAIEGTSNWSESVLDFNSANIGGGIHTRATSNIYMTSSTCKNNTAFNGGCAKLEGQSLWISTEVLHNSATTGGGIYTTGNCISYLFSCLLMINDTRKASIVATTIRGNEATTNGGGVFIGVDSVNFISNCSVSSIFDDNIKLYLIFSR